MGVRALHVTGSWLKSERPFRNDGDVRARMLSRILTAKSGDGRTYTDGEAVLEVHHFFIAGFIVYALLAGSMLQLALKPELRERCVREIRAHAAAGPLTLEALRKLSTLTCVVLEAKRYVPLVPIAFGRAKRSFECEGFAVPENWTVYLALWLNNRNAAIYTRPDEFDPDRFSLGRAEHQRHPWLSYLKALSHRPAIAVWDSITPLI
jgi:retinoid hydroxylase